MLEKVRIDANKRKDFIYSSSNYNEIDRKIIDIIIELVSDDACFLKIDRSLSFEILSLIGYSSETIQDIYVSLMQESSYLLKGKYNLIENNNFIKNVKQ